MQHLKHLKLKSIFIWKTRLFSHYRTFSNLFRGFKEKDQTYIAKTKQHLATRFSEHLSWKSPVQEHMSSWNSCSAISNVNDPAHANNDINNKNDALCNKQ